MKNILVIGGLGYVGAQLVPKLLENDYKVTIFDLGIYSFDFTQNPNLKVVKGDVRDIKKLERVIDGQEAIIHLACISNDPSVDLNPALGKSINFDCFLPLISAAKKRGVKRFIYASSASVYGVKDLSNVTEKASLDPITDYAKFKAQCEDVLFSNTSNDFIGCAVRPATVCGYSPRQRLDLTVNILTNFAFHKRRIKIFGGTQLRPNIHMSDMVDSYILLLKSNTDKIKDQVFNVGFENHSVESIALIVKTIVGDDVALDYYKSDDIRSYHINSDKILKSLSFKPKKNINLAVKDLISAFENKKLTNTFENNEYFNIKKMKNINLS